jgi:hypothetical protein
MHLLYQLLDIHGCVHLVRSALRGIDGLSARIFLLAFAPLLWILFAILWKYDVSATYDYTEPWGLALASALPTWAALGDWTVPALLAALGVSSTVVQFTFPRLAAHVAMRVILNASIIFDLITDFPQVEADVRAFLLPGMFTAMPFLATEPFAFLVTWGTLFACVVTASFVLQTVFFALAVGFWELLPRAFQDRQRRSSRQRATVDGEVV